jgi:diacylglycerol kinase family enzyme
MSELGVAGTCEMSQPWVAIVRNRRSGTGRRREEIRALIAGLRRHGLRPRLYSKRERLSERLTQSLHGDSLVAVVAAGGDGTINDCVNRFTGVPLAAHPTLGCRGGGGHCPGRETTV